jgi:hypothetical protein
MRSVVRRALPVALFAALAMMTLWTLHASSAPTKLPGGASNAAVQKLGAGTTPAGPLPTGDGAQSADVRDLDARIKSLRADEHAQIDPLEAQIKSLRDKFDPQIQDLVTQRKQLVESSESPALRDLDQQEDQEMAALAEKEKMEIEKVRQDFSEQRKALQAKYAEEKQEARKAK